MEEFPNLDNISIIEILIDPVIDVITYQTAYGPSDWVAEIGGSLGLWLGLSLVGILEMIHVGWKKLKDTCPVLCEKFCQKEEEDSVVTPVATINSN